MPKRIGFLFEQVVSEDNCALAIREMARSKPKVRRAQQMKNRSDELGKKLSEQLSTWTWNPKPYHRRTIGDGINQKQRNIKIPCLWDQCVHHALMQVTAPYIERRNYFYNCGSIQTHYSADNIAKRDEWMKSVNRELEENSNRWKELSEKLDRNNADTLILKIESMRSAILSLAQRAFDPTIPITHEEFKRVFRIHEEYQDIIDREHLKNGEVEAAMMVVNEGYRERLKTHNFIEDMRGYHGKSNE